ncbi:MAG: MFS transporter [bacterium]|nr:MFS transporter [bacterium]
MVAIYLNKSGFSVVESNSIMAMFEVGGFFGALAAGWISDLVFKGKRGQINIIYMVGILVCILGFWMYTSHSIIISGIMLFFIGFFIYGPQFMIGLAAIELSHIEAAGTVTGFLGLCGYLGTAISGAPVGYIVQYHGWSVLYLILALLGVVSVLCLIPAWNKRSRSDTIKKPKKPKRSKIIKQKPKFA